MKFLDSSWNCFMKLLKMFQDSFLKKEISICISTHCLLFSSRVDTKFQSHKSIGSDFKAILVICLPAWVMEQIFDHFNFKISNS